LTNRARKTGRKEERWRIGRVEVKKQEDRKAERSEGWDLPLYHLSIPPIFLLPRLK
jgi:hypothetical protein